MGLLDGLQSDQGLLGLSLLAAAAPRAGGRTGFGEGLLGAVMAMQQRKTAEEDRAMKKQLLQAQLAETQAQAQQRAAQAQQAQQAAAQQAAFRRALQGGTIGPQQAMAGGGGPSIANAAQLGQQQAPDIRALAMQFPEQAELLQKLAGAGDWGRPEVARTEETMADGRPVRQQFDKFGRPVGSALPQWKAPVQADTGGALNFIDPVSLQRLQSLSKTNTPGELLSAQTSMRGQNMADARAREKNQIDRDAVGKVDWKQDVNGSWIGLPKEVSGQGPVNPVAVNAPGKREQQARNALDIIKEAEALIDKGTGSYVGAGIDQVARAFGGAPAGAVAGGQLKALEGALMMAQPRMEGPQSNMDVQLYRQMAAQIGDPTVPPKIKKAALGTIRGLHEKYPGGTAQPQSQAGAPRVGEVRRGYVFKGGDPSQPSSWEKQ